jgi:RND family efflux transporter MFP subunit
MFQKYMLPALVVVLIAFSVGHALYVQRAQPESPPPVPPPTTPFSDTVAGAGIIEPSSEASGTGNIAIGSQLAGVVTTVPVRIGQTVKAGDLLFGLDSRQADADLKVRQAAVPVNQAQVEVAKANLRQMDDQYKRGLKLLAEKAIAEQDFVTSEQAYMSALAQVAVAKANVEQARALVEQDKTMLELLQVRAPKDGTILQVNVRPGEYVSTLGSQSLILMGNLQPLFVRVNVDEEDIPRLRLNAPACAKIRGDAKQEKIPLKFVRLEPYVVPKVSMTGINVERVDTRVVQVIYSIEPNHPMVRANKALVGQLVDVFIDTRSSGGSLGSR